MLLVVTPTSPGPDPPEIPSPSAVQTHIHSLTHTHGGTTSGSDAPGLVLLLGSYSLTQGRVTPRR